jgi:hypothetical protein
VTRGLATRAAIISNLSAASALVQMLESSRSMYSMLQLVINKHYTCGLMNSGLSIWPL